MNKGIGIIADNSFGQRSVMDQKMMQEYSPCLREIKEGYEKIDYCDCNSFTMSDGRRQSGCDWCKSLNNGIPNSSINNCCGQCCGQ